jgi:signal transduction histidine kinase/ActR/RegA family two-component response regulator
MQTEPGPAETLGPGSRVHGSARDRLRFGCLGAIGASTIYLAWVWLVHREVAWSITLSTGAVMAVCAGIILWVNAQPMRPFWYPALGAVMLTSMSVNLGYSFVLVRSTSFAVFMVLQVLAAGAMHSHTRWLMVGLAAALATWLTAGFATLGVDFAMTAAVLTAAGFIAMLLHMVTLRFTRSIERLRERDRAHHAELATALDAVQRELCERKRAEAEREHLREQLLDAQKLEAIATLAGGVAHDMNNVLGAILGLAEEVGDGLNGRKRESVDQILLAARRGTDLTRNLLGFSRRGQYRKEQLELSSVVESVVLLLSRTLPSGIELTTANASRSAVDGDRAQLSQALVNLCINSRDAMNGAGRLHIAVADSLLAGDEARAHGLPDGRYVSMTVSDTGCGMDRQTRSRMFEPFFTTKEQGRGTGLGLAMVYGTITAHGGAIAVDTEPGRGTSIAIHLPAAERAAARAPALPAAPDHAGAGGVVLLVDDEEMLRAVTRRALERVGYEVIEARNGAEGVERFRARRDIGLVVLDMAMPVMGGAECFRQLRAIDPNVRVLLASGHTIEQDARACLAAGALGFLEKPFRTARLLEALANIRQNRRLDESFALPSIS